MPWNYAQNQAAIRASLKDGNSCTPSITIAAAETCESHLTDYLKGQVWIKIIVRLYNFFLCFYTQSNLSCCCFMLQISSYFTDKLLGIVRDTIFHMKELSRSENEQNVPLGMQQLAVNVNKGDAALEFIKHVCAVLALDQNVQHDVLVIFVRLFSCCCLNLLSFKFYW